MLAFHPRFPGEIGFKERANEELLPELQTIGYKMPAKKPKFAHQSLPAERRLKKLVSE